MVARNWPWHSVLWKLPIRLSLDALNAWKSLLQGQPGYWWGVFQAHLYFFKWLIINLNKVGRGTNKVDGFYKGSIIWQYFILSKNYFSQIVKRN